MSFYPQTDPFNSHPTAILDGTVGAFRFVAEERRKAFVDELAQKIDTAVARPFGRVVSLYPDCPMRWMAQDLSADRDASIKAVRDAFFRLFEGKEPHAGFCRALPLNRFFAHQKVYIANHMTEMIEAIEQYPLGRL